MSYKDGIPLLSTFEDDPEDDGYGISSEVEKRKCKCAKGHLCFGAVLVFAMVLVIALAVSITLGFTLKNKSDGSHPAASGHNTGHTTKAIVGLSSMSLLPSSSNGPVSTSGSPVFVSSSSSVQSLSSQSLQSESGTVPGQSSGTGGPSLVPTMSTGASFTASASSGPGTPSSGVIQPSLTVGPQSSSAVSVPVSSVMVSSSSSEVLTSSAVYPPASSVMPSVSSATPSLSLATPSISSALPVSSSPIVSSTSAVQSQPIPTPTPTPAPPPSCDIDSVVCPSQQDNRTYFFTTLPDNKLRVLLISDPSTDLSGASMNVAAGSFNDPANYTGLAHFCEHMLFLGTEKYPDKNEYSNYLSTHGGYDNAYTDSQETNYFFRIQAGYLDHALDLFAQFFISPLFNAVYVQKELNAVNQEHQKNLLSDNWKLWQLLKHVSNPEHPFHQFSTGDFSTLNKSDVRDQLLQYYHARYSASTMNLVVYGRESISTLMDLVTRSFSNITNTNAQPLTYPNSQPFYNYASRTIVYEPQASTNTLSLFWQTLTLQNSPRSAVDQFIVRYLSHEGDGSIFKYLQMLNFASELTANVEVAADSFYLFKLQITLTESGLSNVSQVIRTVFEFLDIFKNMSEEEFNKKWVDFVQVSQVAFDYKEKEPPSDYVKDISRMMRVNTFPADFLPNPLRYIPDFNTVHNTLRRFTPGNCLIFIGTKNVNVSSELSLQDNFAAVLPGILPSGATTVPLPTLDLQEPIYSTPFTIYGTPAQLISYWIAPANNSQLYLPGPNMFIPDEDNLIPVAPSAATTPVQISNDLTETWMFPDTATFDEPKVNLRCELKAGKTQTTPQWAAMTQLYLGMVTNKLGSTVFSAMEVGYTLSLKPNPRGVELELGGLSDDNIVQRLINTTIRTLINDGDMLRDSVIFDLAISDIRNTLQNFNYTNLPFRYTYQYLQRVLLERPTWTNEAILQQLEGLNLSTVLDFGDNRLMSDLSVVCFTHGSTSLDSTISYVKLLNSLLSGRFTSSPSSNSGFPTTRVLLPTGKEYGLTLPTFNPVDSNSVVNVLFQAGEVCHFVNNSCTQDSLLTGVYLSLLNLVISDACFTQLRTIEGLGYVVFCFSRTHENIGSFQVIVQSEEFDPGHVLNSTNSFLTNFWNNTIRSAEFEDHFTDTLDVLRLSLTQKDLTLTDKTDRLWQEIMSGGLHFDLKEEQVQALDNLMVDDFQEFYRELIVDRSTWKKLTVVVYGEGKELDLDVDCDILYDQIEQTGTDLKASCS